MIAQMNIDLRKGKERRFNYDRLNHFINVLNKNRINYTASKNLSSKYDIQFTGCKEYTFVDRNDLQTDYVFEDDNVCLKIVLSYQDDRKSFCINLQNKDFNNISKIAKDHNASHFSISVKDGKLSFIIYEDEDALNGEPRFSINGTDDYDPVRIFGDDYTNFIEGYFQLQKVSSVADRSTSGTSAARTSAARTSAAGNTGGGGKQKQDASKGFIEKHFNIYKNIILYGPPGTGKTLYTKELSAIIATKNKIHGTINDNYKKLVNSNQIVFTTFHQSYAYEEFMEGIKPIVNGSNVEYQVRDGIFKRLSIIALANYLGISDVNVDNVIKTIDELFSPENNQHYIELKNIIKTKINITNNNTEHKNYVLIIDEINRGNISQIFGELITLIEGDKRYYQTNMLSVTLPYSGETFVVPPNLWIIGTMNTADRSAESLDTALRRRFIFIEMPPVYRDLVTISNVNIAEMLKRINDRIFLLKGKDYEIGHGYFTGLTQSNSIEDIHNIITYSILPLLEEYFYNDYKKIRYVLGDAFAINMFSTGNREFEEPLNGNWGSDWDGDNISKSDEFIEVVRPLSEEQVIKGIISKETS